jgi:molybdate transport system ATP-binding protein
MAEEPALTVTLRQVAPVPLDVHLEVGNNELLALVGPSGAGKTTVLRAIAGLNRPAAGLVRANGVTWFSSEKKIFVGPQARAVGLVFQDYALFPHLSALENVAIALGPVTAEERSARARALLARVRLDGVELRRPGVLSGGERQRVALARALARGPSVLLLDEPFSAVDRLTREHLKRELSELRGSLGIPVVLVTHDISEALALADRVSVLDHGVTLQTGAPVAVRANPVSAVVADILGVGGSVR